MPRSLQSIANGLESLAKASSPSIVESERLLAELKRLGEQNTRSGASVISIKIGGSIIGSDTRSIARRLKPLVIKQLGALNNANPLPVLHVDALEWQAL